jgi:aerobic-type carbon monoxide dehydrogenase small subunit (CoxS/CutS family)
MPASVTLTVNGQSKVLDIDPSTPLLYALRDDFELNAAKFGCGLGQCGACTVLADGKPVYSCLLPVAAAQGRQIVTVEGLGADGRAPRAFVAEQAAQCGYCIAGMIMRAEALLRATPRPTEAQIREGLQPNLCRCGTHMRILRAVRRAAGLPVEAEG